VDEIENLEKFRDEGIKPSGPLSEEMKEAYMNKIPAFRIEREPIFDSILLNMVLGNSVNLKKKARIKVRDSAVLIGIIDEDGLLNEGEVFVRIQR
jgi:RNA dependent RNA polymerase